VLHCTHSHSSISTRSVAQEQEPKEEGEEKGKKRTSQPLLRPLPLLSIHIIPAILPKVLRRLPQEVSPWRLEQNIANERSEAFVGWREAEGFVACAVRGAGGGCGGVVGEDGLEEVEDGAVGEVEDVCEERK
jgi:hypothetical protein